jgi:PhoH-like ATPase
MGKYFVLDTNVLLHNSDSISSFEDNNVILPMKVIEELDKFKSRNDELGRNARQTIRSLDCLREKGSLREGVKMENGGTLRILSAKDLAVDTGLDMGVADNQILSVAYYLHKNSKLENGDHVIFVTKDINARIKADALGVAAQDFEKEKINFDELFTGQRELVVPKTVVDEFYSTEVMQIEGYNLLPNEFVLLKDEENEKHTGIGKVNGDGELAHLNPQNESAWNIRSRSKEQRMAFELLMDPEVQLVTLVGKAGTGKTLLALAAGLEMTQRYNRYEKLLVSRPVIPLGKDIGYLPGTKDEKLTLWMQPIFDNLTYLMGGSQSPNGDESSVRQKVEKLLKDNEVELEALSYIRGRSIPHQYVIVDEAQNLTPHEIKTIVSRAGEGTKMVLTGDPYQIDNPYLDSNSNGLTYTVERLKGMAVHGHITLTRSERSSLAGIAAEYL